MKINEPNQKHLPSIAPHKVENLLDDLSNRFQQAGRTSWQTLQQKIHEAVELELAAEDMTRDELSLISAYLEKELKHMGSTMQETGLDLSAWLKFDLSFLENSLKEKLYKLADNTQVQHELLREQLTNDDLKFVEGERVFPGRFHCLNCEAYQDITTSSQSLQHCVNCQGHLFERSANPFNRKENQ